MSLIFQAVPERYDLRTSFKQGLSEGWVASRYRDYMIKGEIIYFWQAGDISHRGLYGWGIIKGLPEADEDGYWVEVKYGCNFLDYKPPIFISSEQLKAQPALSSHLLFRNAIGTNFLLNADQDKAIRSLILKNLGKNWLPPNAPQPN